MARTRRVLLLAFVLAGMPLLSGCLSGGQLVGQPAPSFEFVTNKGQVVNETTYLGQWLILDLMATWCGPCKLEVGHLREVQERYGERVTIISIGADPTETMADLEAFGEKYGATWPYTIDRDRKLATTFQMSIIPKLVIIDPQGNVAFERQGEVLPAAIARVIDPAGAPQSPSLPTLALLAGAAAGLLAPFNPYRRFHRDGGSLRPTFAAIVLFALLAALAWPFAALVSSRATYGSLAVGAVSLVAAGYWLRVRSKRTEPAQGTWLQQAGDRAYEAGPHFALALLVALSGTSALAFFAPLGGFLAGALGGALVRERVPESRRTLLGLVGLTVVGAALLAFGVRILLADS